jgi:predicted DCC family thiol-disulfide oxidoreductase YuxK
LENGPVSNTMIYDGDCAICARLARFTARRLRPDAEIRASQTLDLEAYGVTAAECAEALQFVTADGRVYAAQDAVARMLLVSRPVWRPAGAVLRLPGVNALAGVVYRWVARNRYRLPGSSDACAVPQAGAPRAGRAPREDARPLP